MYKRLLTFSGICCVIVALPSCTGAHEDRVMEINNGAFKVLIRERVFKQLGNVNIDICVANISDARFPNKKGQCFLNGYDFDGLEVKWTSERDIVVCFKDGRVSHFTNYAFVYPKGDVPVQFHAVLCEGGDRGPN
jgi:hypothetical protein